MSLVSALKLTHNLNLSLTHSLSLSHCIQPVVAGREVGGWGRDPQKCSGRDWGMGSSTIQWNLRPVVKYHLRRGVGFMKFLENGSRPQPPTSPHTRTCTETNTDRDTDKLKRLLFVSHSHTDRGIYVYINMYIYLHTPVNIYIHIHIYVYTHE